MAELVIGITPQPNFPREDLTDSNANLLELMMANKEIVTLQHNAIEKLSWSFKIGHKALLTTSSRVFEDVPSLIALNHGISVFKAIAASVVADVISSDTQGVMHRTSELLQLEDRAISSYCEQATEDFSKSAPRTADVITSSASRFYGHLATYAFIGAASSWRFKRSIEHSS